MPIVICPLCDARVVTDITNTDVNHSCDTDSIYRFEDVLKIGEYQDTPEQGGDSGNDANWNWQGLQNKIEGSRSNIEHGARVHSVTSRGNNADTHRQRIRVTNLKIRPKNINGVMWDD